MKSFSKRQVVDEVEHRAMGLVELETAPRGRAVSRILKIAIFISTRLAVSHGPAKRIRESVHQTMRIAFLKRRLQPVVRAIAITVDEPQTAQVLNTAIIVKLLIRPPLLEIRIRRWIRTVEVGDRIPHVAGFAADVSHRERRG